MRIITFTGNSIFVLAFLLIVSACTEKVPEDPCLKTKWTQAKEYEIKLAVHIMASNPQLPGGTVGSLSPADYEKMMVNGTIEQINCDGSSTGACTLGNSYITKGTDDPAPIFDPESYWIGHFVYVYDLDNDEDHLNLVLHLKITMLDGQSYTCDFSDAFYDKQIVMVPGEMYYYIMLDVYSDLWVKVTS
jgi:hypothetical protein